MEIIRKRSFITAAILLFCFVFIAAQSLFAEVEFDEKVLYEFQEDPTDFRWYALNDTVMGGRSRSGMTMAGDGVVAFLGDVSLENNGGFASIRSEAFRFGIDGYQGVKIRVRGDGKTYKLRLQTRMSSSINFEQSFETTAGEWIDVNLRFEDFKAVYFGRLVQNAKALEPKDIRTIGFMISDKQTGEFRIEIDTISAFKFSNSLEAASI